MLFLYQRHNLSRSGLRDDFLPGDFVKLLHEYYTVYGLKQAELSPMVTSPLLQLRHRYLYRQLGECQWSIGTANF
jgi:hypothetical protein